MCGIVGILGREPVADQLIDSLKRLEYRGYDSAGIATLEHGHLTRLRAEGKLKNLEQRLARDLTQHLARQPRGGEAGGDHTEGAEELAHMRLREGACFFIIACAASLTSPTPARRRPCLR